MRKPSEIVEVSGVPFLRIWTDFGDSADRTIDEECKKTTEYKEALDNMKDAAKKEAKVKSEVKEEAKEEVVKNASKPQPHYDRR